MTVRMRWPRGLASRYPRAELFLRRCFADADGQQLLMILVQRAAKFIEAIGRVVEHDAQHGGHRSGGIACR